MALKLDNALLEELGLGALPEGEKQLLLRQIYEKLEMNVGVRLADQMSNEQLDEFEKFVDANDDKGAFQWLETNFPNYKDVVNSEFEKLKIEIKQYAPQMLAVAQQNSQSAQNSQTPQIPPQPQQPLQYQEPQPPSPASYQQGAYGAGAPQSYPGYQGESVSPGNPGNPGNLGNPQYQPQQQYPQTPPHPNYPPQQYPQTPPHPNYPPQQPPAGNAGQ